jgi:hypothetical protein
MEFWSQSYFISNGNSIGHSIALEKDYWLKEDKSLGKILIEVNMREGLPTESKIH